MKEWKHIFKLDPAKPISDEHLEWICESGTDAIIVGGTDNVTLDGVLDLLASIRMYSVDCILEVSTMDAVTPGFDYYFIPMVMNSTEKKWMMDIQHEAVKQYKDLMNWDEISVEGYCILNQAAKAYKKANCTMPDEQDVVAYAYMAERMFQLPIFYMEYSGTYGDPKLVQRVRRELNQTLLFYGGGIETPEQAREMKQHADVIIVGNIIYTDIKKALDTVTTIQHMEKL
ncbi:heptaprenylglyceryl phosphate synthase [Virgibacillus sp. W0430]|uniref:heptaprenylglyceryl phosphate synthase n=1 Tax=Virgibacillus sp. W0430 TaxID=3391580 RepID=UPI003F45A9AD